MRGEYPREWFRVGRWTDEPFARIFDRETDAFLIRKDGRRDKKWTNYERWYPTREEAQAAIDKRKEGEGERKRMDLIRDAAPDLLAALDVFVAEADAGHVTVETDRAARAAIAKARPSPCHTNMNGD